MKYRLELILNKPRSEVWQAFTDSERMKLWQPALISVELISGRQGQPGAVSKMRFHENNREFTLLQTITHSQEPDSLHQRFENQFAENTVKHSFTEQGQDQTVWVTETEYKFKTFLMKVIGPLYKKNFALRTKREMERFKEMMENTQGNTLRGVAD